MKAKLVFFIGLVLGCMTMSSYGQLLPTISDAGTFPSLSAFQSSSLYSPTYSEVTSVSQFADLFGLTTGDLTTAEQALIQGFVDDPNTYFVDPSAFSVAAISPPVSSTGPSSTSPISMSPSSPGVEAAPDTGFITVPEFFALPQDLKDAAIATMTSDVDPDPQGISQRTTQSLRNAAVGRLGGIHAGVEAPELAEEGGDSLHFEYNYIDASLDTPGVGIASETNVYALGYERYLGGGIYLDLTYEYADNALQAGALGVNGDSHTVAGSLSADLVNNIYGMLIVGGSWNNGSTNLAGAQVVGTNGSTFFINPGLGTSWALGDIIIDGSISYLYLDGSTTSVVGGVPVTASTQVDQVIVDLGATYNFTDSLYARVGVQYNNIWDDNFGAAIPVDENWVQINSEIGARIGANSNVYVGHAYDAGHNIYDIHTYRAGFSYGF